MATCQEESQEKYNPLPPNTKCQAVYSFTGEQPQDLSFSIGEELVIIEPSAVLYWYVARNARGDRGNIPITFCQVLPNDTHPPAPPPIPHRLSDSHAPPPPVSRRQDDSNPLPPPILLNDSFPPPPIPRRLNDSHTLPPPISRRQVVQNDSNSLPPPILRKSKSDSSPPPPILRKSNSSPPPPIPRRQGTAFHSKSTTLPRAAMHPTAQLSSFDDNSVFSSIDTRPPMPLPAPNTRRHSPPTSSTNIVKLPPPRSAKYAAFQNFCHESGWFTPNLDVVLATKICCAHQVFREMRHGVYYFQHKYDRTKHYAGKSLQLYVDLTQLFTRLYEKPVQRMNPLEIQLRFHNPDANLWNVRAYEYDLESLNIELSKLIVQQRCLHPEGLNEKLTIMTKQDFSKFCEWYTKERLKKK